MFCFCFQEKKLFVIFKTETNFSLIFKQGKLSDRVEKILNTNSSINSIVLCRRGNVTHMIFHRFYIENCSYCKLCRLCNSFRNWIIINATEVEFLFLIFALLSASFSLVCYSVKLCIQTDKNKIIIHLIARSKLSVKPFHMETLKKHRGGCS